MKDKTLCKFLRDNSSGIYRPCAEAAARIEVLAKENERFRIALKAMNQPHQNYIPQLDCTVDDLLNT